MWPKLTRTHVVVAVLGHLQETGDQPSWFPWDYWVFVLKFLLIRKPLSPWQSRMVGHPRSKTVLSNQFPHVIWGKKKERELGCFPHVIRKQPTSDEANENWCVNLGILKHKHEKWCYVLEKAQALKPDGFMTLGRVFHVCEFSHLLKGGNDTDLLHVGCEDWC